MSYLRSRNTVDFHYEELKDSQDNDSTIIERGFKTFSSSNGKRCRVYFTQDDSTQELSDDITIAFKEDNDKPDTIYIIEDTNSLTEALLGNGKGNLTKIIRDIKGTIYKENIPLSPDREDKIVFNYLICYYVARSISLIDNLTISIISDFSNVPNTSRSGALLEMKKLAEKYDLYNQNMEEFDKKIDKLTDYIENEIS